MYCFFLSKCVHLAKRAEVGLGGGEEEECYNIVTQTRALNMRRLM